MVIWLEVRTKDQVLKLHLQTSTLVLLYYIVLDQITTKFSKGYHFMFYIILKKKTIPHFKDDDDNYLF